MTMIRKKISLLATAATAIALLATSASAYAAPPERDEAHRVIAYYQTQYEQTDERKTYVSPMPLKNTATHIQLAAIHLNDDGTLTINDDVPTARMYDRVWTDLKKLQEKGIKVSAMLGGAGVGSFANLNEDFNKYYPLLRDFLKKYSLDGVDIDIEEPFSLEDTVNLIDHLRADFGEDFIITLTPVASDLAGETNFSGGFDYSALEELRGEKISWYNAQFYCGWASLSSTNDYNSVVSNGFDPSQVVAIGLTNPVNCGSGYVDNDSLDDTVTTLADKYPEFAGVAGWEYFNATSLSPDQPAQWYKNLAKAMKH